MTSPGDLRVTEAADAVLTQAAMLRNLESRLAELHTVRETIAAAAGTYDCPEPCDGYFELFEDSSIEDYAALNRWLGRHELCAVTYGVGGAS